MKIFLTEYRLHGQLYADRIRAKTWEEADRIALDRGRGETVVGELMAAIPAEKLVDVDVRALIVAMTERWYSTVH